MAITRSTFVREERQRWIKDTQTKANGLLAHSDEVSADVFSSLENFTSFLELTTRVHHYDAYNILLIWERLSSASFLAGFPTWQRQLPEGTRILKPEYIGKGIDIVSPFTDRSSTDTRLVWYTLKVFDISQTTLPAHTPVFDPAYVHDYAHEYFLMDAIRLALGTKYHRSIIMEPPSQTLREFGLPGQINEQEVIVRDDLPHLEQLQWLTEALAKLSLEDSGLSSASIHFMQSCVSYCLLHIWELQNEAHLSASTAQLKTVPAEQRPEFLHVLRDSVRYLNNLICSFYLLRRQETEAEMDDSDMNILSDYF